MLTRVHTGDHTISGVSVGGVYTCLNSSLVSALFDVGIAPRSFAGVDTLFLSHGHADHIGALVSMLGLRGLMKRGPLRVFMPEQIHDSLILGLKAMSDLQRYSLDIDAVVMKAGDEYPVKSGLVVRAFRTFHTVPSLGYSFLRRTNKLKAEYHHLGGPEIGERRKRGEDLFYVKERLELAYATDTLVRVLDETPALYDAQTLILECSFLDGRKSRDACRAGCHIHLDELLERATLFRNKYLVLMHFSQIYRPDEVRDILKKRCPSELFERIVPFAPRRKHWPG